MATKNTCGVKLTAETLIDGKVVQTVTVEQQGLDREGLVELQGVLIEGVFGGLHKLGQSKL